MSGQGLDGGIEDRSEGPGYILKGKCTGHADGLVWRGRENSRKTPQLLARMSEWLEVSFGDMWKVQGRRGWEGKLQPSVDTFYLGDAHERPKQSCPIDGCRSEPGSPRRGRSCRYPPGLVFTSPCWMITDDLLVLPSVSPRKSILHVAGRFIPQGQSSNHFSFDKKLQWFPPPVWARILVHPFCTFWPPWFVPTVLQVSLSFHLPFCPSPPSRGAI